MCMPQEHVGLQCDCCQFLFKAMKRLHWRCRSGHASVNNGDHASWSTFLFMLTFTCLPDCQEITGNQLHQVHDTVFIQFCFHRWIDWSCLCLMWRQVYWEKWITGLQLWGQVCWEKQITSLHLWGQVVQRKTDYRFTAVGTGMLRKTDYRFTPVGTGVLRKTDFRFTPVGTGCV